MSSIRELRRVARFKGIPEFTCERCGLSYKLETSPTSMVYDDPRVLEIHESLFALPVIQCRAHVACERRRLRRGQAAAQPERRAQ